MFVVVDTQVELALLPALSYAQILKTYWVNGNYPEIVVEVAVL